MLDRKYLLPRLGVLAGMSVELAALIAATESVFIRVVMGVVSLSVFAIVMILAITDPDHHGLSPWQRDPL